MLNWSTGELQLPDITLKHKTMLQDVVNVYGSDVRIFVKEPYLVTYFKRAIDVGEGLQLRELLFSSKGKLKKMVFLHNDITPNVPITDETRKQIATQFAAHQLGNWGEYEINDEYQVVISWKTIDKSPKV